MTIIQKLARDNKANPLSKQETSILIIKAQDGCEVSRNTVVEKNIGLVYRIINTITWFNDEQREEAFQNGIFGLMKAIKLFNVSKGFCFSTYANWWIFQAITKKHDESQSLIRFPIYLVQLNKKLRKIRSQNPDEDDEFVINELIRQTKISKTRINKLISFKRDKLSLDCENAEGERYIEIEYPHQNSLKEYEYTELNDLLKIIDPRSRQILTLRSQCISRNKIGKMFNISKERVYQIEKVAMNKLKDLVKKDLKGL
ncbi:sigma-70 family RNA polymerase sigma factor [Candidatus Dependentiae bacterium]|nr:MAG: sigma-70 family RNA polymerase sigma factor [Candidatus Dependentiae bacterium]